MRTYSFTLAGARLAYLLTITRRDETVIRVTGYSKSITISSQTWTPDPGLEIGDITETNDGSIPNLTVKFAVGSLFAESDILNRLYEGAEAVLEICDARNPTTKDEEFRGVLKGDIEVDRGGNGQFEILNKFGLGRDVWVRKYLIEDDVDFGDPRRSKIPTFPTVDPTSDDLADVERSTALALGDRRRFRYDANDDPSDYHDVYWEVTVAGTTGPSEPALPSDTPGDIVPDGSATFTVRNAYARAFEVASIIDDRNITITVTEPRASGDTTWFAPGLLVMRSGALMNWSSDIDAWDGVDQISLVVPFASQLEVGDWGEIAPDYDQTLDMAVSKYSNANNYRGFPHLTGSRISTSTYVDGTTTDNYTDGDDPGYDGGGGGGGGGYLWSAVEFEDGSS
jgi:hypothetical protein